MNGRRALAALLLASLLVAARGAAQEAIPAAAQDLLTRANAARLAHGLPVLRLEEHLSAMAQRRAEEQARAGMLVRSLDSMGLLERTQASGYEAHSIAELLASTSSGVPELFTEWEHGSSKSYRELLAPEAKDLGAGEAEADGVTYVSLLVGLSLPDFFRQQTAGLQDLAAMRQEMLAATNAAQRSPSRGTHPRASSGRLRSEVRSADAAELTLRTPRARRTTVRERAQAAGYGEFTALGENIAQGSPRLPRSWTAGFTALHIAKTRFRRSIGTWGLASPSVTTPTAGKCSGSSASAARAEGICHSTRGPPRLTPSYGRHTLNATTVVSVSPRPRAGQRRNASMSKSSRILVLFVLAIVTLTGALLAQSQATTGVIEGTVVDPSGAALPGATVAVKNTATNFEKTITTEADGRFRALLLPLGPYQVTASLQGFATLIRDGLDLQVGQSVNLQLQMQISAVQGADHGER